jgi:hypothetical protein
MSNEILILGIGLAILIIVIFFYGLGILFNTFLNIIRKIILIIVALVLVIPFHIPIRLYHYRI